MQYKIFRVALVTVFILLIPFVSMQFTSEVNWTLADFVFAGILLFGSGLTFELIARTGSTAPYRIAVGVAVAASLLLVWINGAVGIIGNENNPANLLYGAVLVTLLIGSIVALLEPRGMARTLFTTAIVQALVPFIAILIWNPQATYGGEAFWGSPGVWGILALNAFFVALWAASGSLFRRAAI